ncbi:MAG: histidine kinase [Spirochaetaceae bacterium]
MLIKLFRDQKLRNKLLIIYIIGFLIPMITINTLFSYNLYIKELNFNKKYIEHELAKTAILIQNEFNEALQIIYSVYINQELSDFIQNDNRTQNEYLTKRNRIFKVDSILNQFRTYNMKYSIYTKNSTFRPDPIIKRIDNTTESELWYREYINSNETGYIFYSNSTPNNISIIRALDYLIPKDKRFNTILKVDIPISKLQKHINFFSDQNGITLLSSKYETIASNNITVDSNNIITHNFEDMRLLSGWSLEGRLNKIDFIENQFSTDNLAIIIPLFLAVLLGSILIYLLSRSFYRRIYSLSISMKSVKDGHFNSVLIEGEQKDEISELATSYNIMINQIDKLIGEVTEANLREKNIELSKNKAQLTALISQINPHYLFNVLESIRMKSVIKGEKETANIIKHLSKSFRHTISWDESIVTIEKEIEIAKDFLAVQKYRFAEKLSFEFDVEPNCLGIKIPRLTIQPFIENSCIHGIEQSTKNCTVKTTIKKNRQDLIIIINDNGVGMSLRQIEGLYYEMQVFNLQSKHIGFSNTYWRLKKQYPELKLDINSEINIGTQIIITIPLTLVEQTS